MHFRTFAAPLCTTAMRHRMFHNHPKLIAMNLLRRTIAPMLLCAIVSLVFGIDTVAAQAPTALPAYSILRADEVKSLRAHIIETVVLGDSKTRRPSVASDVAVVGGHIFVLDGMQRHLLVYDSTGKFLRVAAQYGSHDGGLESPIRLASLGDTVLLLDVTHRNAVSAFDAQGRFLGARYPDLAEASASSMAIGTATVAFAHMDAEDRPARAVVSIRDRRGRELGAGCPSAPTYAQSLKRGGLLARFATRLVDMKGNRVYCAQAVTPVVTILDLQGRTVGHITVAPPFYTPPADIAETRNQKALLDYQSRWTALHGFRATPAGFASTWSRYDAGAGRFVYRFFACDGDVAASNCRTSEIPGEPVRILASDRLLSVTAGADGSVSLATIRFGP